ncbi:aldolase [Pyrococcus yayanosii]|uniref:L-fuculose 1-phosphate aldolase (FucA) n=1 Tax=Pyrococcus yayanosii (strain CH1 / JCM 16557) TaxID=529709 RepID=F8AH80_PYRYC|nr:aldolase [Pyrococcus yayanosii]AEH25310.1 L-fuculose 1-phosphate aldolase (fucA) [Pyrococcus yayanosii CH1]
MRNVKRALVKYSRLAHTKGLTGSFGGNISVRVRDMVFIKGTGAVMGELTEGQVAILKLDGRQVSAVRPSSEWRLHLSVYKVRPDVRAVVHLHPPYSIAVSILVKGELPLLTPEAELYLGRVPVLPFRPAGSGELAEIVAGGLRRADAVLMERHGIVTVGKSLREAFYRAELVEESARLWFETRNRRF